MAQTIKVDEETGERSYRTFARVKVLDIREQLLQEVSDDDAQAEGHQDRGAFFRWWRETYEGVEAPASDAPPFDKVPIWVVHFELDQSHEVRLLHQKSQRGYTRNPHEALAGEPEAVDAGTLAAYASDNRGRHNLFKRGDFDASLAEMTSLEEQLAFLRRQAREKGVGVSADERAIERRLKVMAEKIRRAA